MSAYVLLDLLNELGKRDKMRGLPSILSLFRNEFNNVAGVSLASLRCGPRARHIYPSLVLVQPRKTRSYITEKLLMGRKESNQTIKSIIQEHNC